MNSEIFKKELNRLNKEQRDAVETIAGPVMVIAGPGTGKTQILTLRIANILLETDSSPENILALTFTETAAANMRKRLVDIIGTEGYYVNISTFHSFCNQIIQDNPEKFTDIIGSSPISPENKISILRNIIDSQKLKKIKPIGNLYYYIPAISKAIRDLKNEGVDHFEFKRIAEKEKKKAISEKLYDRRQSENIARAEKNIELAKVYALYQKESRRKKLYDFEDMILETIKTLQKDKDFLLELQEKYQYILVDEHQDTNGAQNKALELLAGYDDKPNLFVVGDEKQAIFRFQGASLENFLYFKNKFPKAVLINLKQNYRSTQNILDGSHSLIEKNTAILVTKLMSREKKPGQKIKMCRLENDESECEFITDSVKNLLDKKIPEREIAILFRENKDAYPILESLTRAGISSSIESDENILENSEIKKLNVLFEAIENFAKPEYIARALHLDFFGLDPIDIYKSIGVKAIKSPSVEKIYKKIGDWKKLNYNVNFAEFFETVARKSGFIAGLISAREYPEKISKLNSLFKEIKKRSFANHKYNLSDYLKDIKILEEYSIPIKSKIPRQDNSIRLMTAHKAKGLEFDYVFICGARDKHWGNKRDASLFKLPIAMLAKLDSTEKNEDERRLFYMAMTRARKEVFITYSAMSDEGREYVPSQFISEIHPDLKEEISIAKNHQGQTLILSRSDLDKPKTDDGMFIKDLFLSRGLSTTSLNNYLRCPWQFFYSNLLRLPQTLSLSQIYGTVKHKALQYYSDNLDIKYLSDLTGKFVSELKKYPISKNDFELLARKGKTSLKAYFDFYKNAPRLNIINEYKISGVDFAVGKEKIKLTGKIDKIEIDPKNKSATVTDYKTSKAKSRNWILGLTKDERSGEYFRQLVFYKLLLDSIPSTAIGTRPRKKFNMEIGAIDFTEPDDQKRFKKEVFEISRSEVNKLRELMEKTADEILNLKFWNSGCGKKDCEFCALRKFMRKDQS